jgi:hypothetical protein
MTKKSIGLHQASEFYPAGPPLAAEICHQNGMIFLTAGDLK